MRPLAVIWVEVQQRHPSKQWDHTYYLAFMQNIEVQITKKGSKLPPFGCTKKTKLSLIYHSIHFFNEYVVVVVAALRFLLARPDLPLRAKEGGRLYLDASEISGPSVGICLWSKHMIKIELMQLSIHVSKTIQHKEL